ncbi:MAG: CHAT domain-containing protein [Myxococcota bacterium]
MPRWWRTASTSSRRAPRPDSAPGRFAEAEVIVAHFPPDELERLSGEEATAAAAAEAIARADWLHFSGHAQADDGWKSHLALAGDDILDVAAVLALPSVPRVVVLNACETGRQSGASSLGIAQAFVAAGSEAVVATSRTVADRVALDFAEAFYAGPPSPFAQRYRTAVLALKRQGEDDAASYRLLTQ